jgi:hypothetical protein
MLTARSTDLNVCALLLSVLLSVVFPPIFEVSSLRNHYAYLLCDRKVRVNMIKGGVIDGRGGTWTKFPHADLFRPSPPKKKGRHDCQEMLWTPE